MPPEDRDGSAHRKARGAYYTDPTAAAALCAWAIRSAEDAVLDPSFGEGVFLRAAADRLAALGGGPGRVYGVEVDREAHANGARSAASHGIPAENLVRRDFFALDADPRFDAVVGNPPFIRFQRFKGDARERAARRARAAGVDVSPLASSWAPFVIHAVGSVAPGGRLALVVPKELGHTGYGRDVLSFLAGTFASVTLVASPERWFPDVDQDTFAVLAERRTGRRTEGRRGDVRLARIERLADLPGIGAEGEPLDLDAIAAGSRTPRFYDLAPATRARIDALEARPGLVRLGDVAKVTSGYVTGANGFFHVSPDRAAELGLGPSSLERAVFRSRALAGIRFDAAAWREAADRGSAGYLFAPGPEPGEPERRYLARGHAVGAHRGYKARHRADWWVVPRVGSPDLLLAAMAAETHALAVNDAGAAPANTLHAVMLRTDSASPEAGGMSRIELARAVAAGWLTSASRLSRELTGRVLGGGMLKLEPGESGRIRIPDPIAASATIGDRAGTLHAMVREGRIHEARRLADAWILRDALGWSEDDVRLVARAATTLREARRRSRDGSVGSGPGTRDA